MLTVREELIGRFGRLGEDGILLPQRLDCIFRPTGAEIGNGGLFRCSQLQLLCGLVEPSILGLGSRARW